ncbi:MAG: hypothetical protein ACQEVA_18695 [Myxococcota bacterium]
MASTNEFQRDPQKLDPVIGITVLVLVLGVVGFAVYKHQTAPEVSEEDITFEPIRVETDRLLAERKERSAEIEPDRAGKDLERLRETARKANEMSFGSPSRLDQQETQKRLSIYANQIIPAYSYDGFIYSAEPLFIECGKGLESLLEAIRRGQITVERARENPPADTFESYRENCGNVLPILIEQGLVTRDGEWTSESGPAIFDVLNRYRWAHVIDDRRKAMTQLTPYEQEILMRWRIEDARAFELADRWRFLDQARELVPSYEVNWAAGVLSLRENNLEQALDYFEKAAAANEREMADDVVEYLEARIRTRDAS